MGTCALLLFAASLYYGSDLTLPWQVSYAFKTRPLLLHYFDINGQASGLVVDQLLSWQQFSTSSFQFLAWPEYVLMATVLLLFICATVAITYVDRFAYYVLAAIFVFIFIQFRLEELGVAEPYFTYGIITGFILLTYGFHSYGKKASLLLRFVCSLALYAIFTSLILLLPDMQLPEMVSLGFGMIALVALGSLFVLYIAGDTIFLLFKITTQGAGKGKEALLHFALIGLLYVIAVGLIFLQKNQIIDFPLFLFEPETLFVLSCYAGYVAFDQKLSSRPADGEWLLFKKWVYVLASAMLLAFLAYARLTANDSLLSALEWVILLSHLAFASAFFIYALINFIPALLSNLEVWQIFYSGPRTPMLTVRLMAFALFLGGIFYLEYKPYYQLKAGQYALLASAAEQLEKPVLAEQYHRQSIFYDFYTFKSNFALAVSAETDREIREVPTRLNAILSKKNAPKVRVALANHYDERAEIYQTLKTLMDSRESANNAKVQNNLGLAHYAYQNYDSALRYFQLALGEGTFVSEGNLAALNYDVAAQTNFDTTFTYEYAQNAHVKLNTTALKNGKQQALTFELTLQPDTLLSRTELFYMYNSALSRQLSNAEMLLSAIDYYLSHPQNDPYRNFLLTAKTFALYHQGEINQAFLSLEKVISNNERAGFPFYTKAIWSYHQGQAEMTIDAINEARKRNYNEPQLLKFIELLGLRDERLPQPDISSEWRSLQSRSSELSDESYRQATIRLAQKNAFDVSTTLKIWKTLNEIEIEPEIMYELFLHTTKVKPKEPSYWKVYILQCAKMRLTGFGETALKTYNTLVTDEEYEAVKSTFEQILDAERNKFLQPFEQ